MGGLIAQILGSRGLAKFLVLLGAGRACRDIGAQAVRDQEHSGDDDPMGVLMEFPHHAHWIFGEPGWESVAGHIHLWLNQAI